MDIEFKAATASDADALLAMMRELYEHERTRFDERAARKALLQLLGDDALGRVWLMRSGGEAAGYVVLTLGFSLEFEGRDAFVDELYVGAAHRGRGLGRRAISFVEEACRALGVRALHLEVERENAAAQALYRKCGFADHDRYLLTKWVDGRER